MSLTRKMLKAMGIEDEKIEQIIEAHTETVDALKEQRDQFKADAEKLSEVQKQLDKAQKQLDSSNLDEYKSKYEAEKAAFKKYKEEQEQRDILRAKTEAYGKIIKSAGIPDKYVEKIIAMSKDAIDGIEFDGDNIKDADGLANALKEEWKDFIPTQTTTGANTVTPPPNSGSGKDPGEMTMKEYIDFRKGV